MAAGNQGASPYSLYMVLCFVVFLYLTNSVVHLYACISSFKFILNYRFGDSAKPDVLLLSLDREPLLLLKTEHLSTLPGQLAMEKVVLDYGPECASPCRRWSREREQTRQACDR